MGHVRLQPLLLLLPCCGCAVDARLRAWLSKPEDYLQLPLLSRSAAPVFACACADCRWPPTDSAATDSAARRHATRMIAAPSTLRLSPTHPAACAPVRLPPQRLCSPLWPAWHSVSTGGNSALAGCWLARRAGGGMLPPQAPTQRPPWLHCRTHIHAMSPSCFLCCREGGPALRPRPL